MCIRDSFIAEKIIDESLSLVENQLDAIAEKKKPTATDLQKALKIAEPILYFLVNFPLIPVKWKKPLQVLLNILQLLPDLTKTKKKK